jgi:hypothetical protein
LIVSRKATATNISLAKLGLTKGLSASYLGQALVVGGHSTNPPTDFCYALLSVGCNFGVFQNFHTFGLTGQADTSTNIPASPMIFVGSNSMTIDTLIIEKAIEEVETKSLGFTKQFLEIHKLVYIDNKPKVARVDTDEEDVAIVYLNVENEEFFLAIYIDTKPSLKVRWINTEPYHAVYFRASSDTLSLKELAELTKLTSTRGRTKGNKKHPNSETEIRWEESTIDFEPNPEPDEFEDKLTKLLDFLEQDKEGIGKLVNHANGYIRVYSSFHNGNTLIGGHFIDKNQIKRMSQLNLEIDFDICADGNFFK